MLDRLLFFLHHTLLCNRFFRRYLLIDHSLEVIFLSFIRSCWKNWFTKRFILRILTNMMDFLRLLFFFKHISYAYRLFTVLFWWNDGRANLYTLFGVFIARWTAIYILFLNQFLLLLKLLEHLLLHRLNSVLILISTLKSSKLNSFGHLIGQFSTLWTL